MLVPIENITQFGVIKDVQDHLLAPNAWSDARNVRFSDIKVSKMQGHVAVFGAPSIVPYFVVHAFTRDQVSAWVYAGLQKVYTYTGGVHTNITRQTAGVDVNYTGTTDDIWDGSLFQGNLLLNNGVDLPQVWAPPDSTVKLLALPNFNTNWRAKVIRPFDVFLVALDVTETGTRYPYRLRWSHPAEPGAVPSSWDEADATKDAGFKEFSDVDGGRLVDARVLGQTLMVYREKSTWGMQFIGGQDKMRTYQVLEGTGLLCKNAVSNFFAGGAQHFAMTGEDIIIHNGQTPTSILDKKDRRWLLSNMSATNYFHSYTVANLNEKECWFCTPLEGATWANLAVVWNWEDNTISFRDLPEVSMISPGQIPVDSSDTWDANTNTWDASTTPWDQLQFMPGIRRLLGSQPAATAGASKLFHFDSSEQFDGSNMLAYIEKTGITIFGMDRYGKPVADKDIRKLIRSIWLRAEGAPLQISVGVKEDPNPDVGYTWSAPKTFTPGTDRKSDFGVAGLYYAIRISATNGQHWEVSGYSIDVEPLGQF